MQRVSWRHCLCITVSCLPFRFLRGSSAPRLYMFVHCAGYYPVCIIVSSIASKLYLDKKASLILLIVSGAPHGFVCPFRLHCIRTIKKFRPLRPYSIRTNIHYSLFIVHYYWCVNLRDLLYILLIFSNLRVCFVFSISEKNVFLVFL